MAKLAFAMIAMSTLTTGLAVECQGTTCEDATPADQGIALLQVQTKTAARVAGATALSVCAGDTRGDGKCDKDETHRVCAKIGLTNPDSSFWKFTGQDNWCRTDIYGDGKIACPEDKPTWCICKWATADWIKGEGCGDAVEFDCSATDVCDLKSSYTDGNVDLQPAHDCMKKKCKSKWEACA
jgi:hypothetical protein